MKGLGIIPARYNSSRLPGKPLTDIMGTSMIQRVYNQVSKCKEIRKVIVATDDERISFHVKSFGGNVIMTSKNHKSGTDRCGEAFKKISEHFDIVVNIQGDEPFIQPFQISQLISLFNDENVKIATLSKKIENYTSLTDEGRVKVFFDEKYNAKSFVRNYEISEEEFHNDNFYKHIGIYAYRKNTLLSIVKLPEGQLEKVEKLEQLRWLENGHKIKTASTTLETIGIDSPEDLNKISQEMLD